MTDLYSDPLGNLLALADEIVADAWANFPNWNQPSTPDEKRQRRERKHELRRELARFHMDALGADQRGLVPWHDLQAAVDGMRISTEAVLDWQLELRPPTDSAPLGWLDDTGEVAERSTVDPGDFMETELQYLCDALDAARGPAARVRKRCCGVASRSQRVDEAPIDRGLSKPSPTSNAANRQSSTATVNARMIDAVQADPARRDWSAGQWATFLSCSKSTIHAQAMWKKIMEFREAQRIGRAMRQK